MQVRMDELISAIGTALDLVEGELLGASTNHGKRIASLCAAMANYLDMPEDEVFAVAACALLHDNALTEYILSERPGKDQQLNLKAHCIYGQRNVDTLPFMTNIDGYILYHHERADGNGLFGKKEAELPLGVQLIAIADMIDAEHHLQTLPKEKLSALREKIKNRTGAQFTKSAAQAMLVVLDDGMLESLRDENVSATYAHHMPPRLVDLQDRGLMGIAGITARIIDYKSTFTRNHSVQIANTAWWMAKSLGLDEDTCARLYLAAALHDIGKLRVPIEILEKPGKLTPEEFGIIKKHVSWSRDMLENVTGLERITACLANHHEKLDGTGYPNGKLADELDAPSRLLACIDIYQAVSEQRPYHPPRTHGETIEIMQGMVGKGLIDENMTAAIDREMAQFDCKNVPSPPGAVI